MVIDLGILSIKVDVLIFQIINIIILLWIIRKAFGDTIVKQIEHFRDTRKQLADADITLKKIIDEAEQTKKEIIQEGKQTKEEIITHAHLTASNKEKELILQAEQKARELVNQATIKTQLMEEELKENYTHMVTQSAGAMVKKIFENDDQAQELYIKKAIEGVSPK